MTASINLQCKLLCSDKRRCPWWWR